MAQQPPLTEAQKQLVADTMPTLPLLLRRRFFRRLVRVLGWDEATQEASLALMHASRKYDPDTGPFVNYAVWWIRHYLTRALAKSTLMRDRNHPLWDRPGPRLLYAFGDADSEMVPARRPEMSDDEYAEAVRKLTIRLTTTAERTVAEYLIGGLRASDIANALGVSVADVRRIRERVREAFEGQ